MDTSQGLLYIKQHSTWQTLFITSATPSLKLFPSVDYHISGKPPPPKILQSVNERFNCSLVFNVAHSVIIRTFIIPSGKYFLLCQVYLGLVETKSSVIPPCADCASHSNNFLSLLLGTCDPADVKEDTACHNECHSKVGIKGKRWRKFQGYLDHYQRTTSSAL